VRRPAFTFVSIGHVENEFDGSIDRGEAETSISRIVLEPELAEGLQGLEAYPRVMVVFAFDRSRGFDLLQHPRGDRSRPQRGVFALCSPRRPNSIGVTVVELLGIEGNVVTVRGLDALNGTPVLDLKPAHQGE
jgi:tRNA-Thr(GGU) m(6)t(6)A37 methyltransferase TsaA